MLRLARVPGRAGHARWRGIREMVWAAATLVFVAAGISRVPAQRDDRGERIMNAGCLACHDVRRIQVQAMDAEQWTRTVNAMVEKGAAVASDDVPLLVGYLVQHHGPMPEGRGKAIVLNVCTLCHDLTRVRRGRRSAEEWEETLNAMLNEGAPLSDDAFPIVHAYLSRNFGTN
jgi:cytochrome c5